MLTSSCMRPYPPDDINYGLLKRCLSTVTMEVMLQVQHAVTPTRVSLPFSFPSSSFGSQGNTQVHDGNMADENND